MSRFRIVAAAVLMLLALPMSRGGQNDGYQPQTGHVHPEFTLPRIGTRESVSLSAYRGKKVLLIHFASW